ncbi:MAG TPA: tetratricopeptide repeat protein [Pyrinomonadaceae bacterium]|nr:tetratricopeptide repeat protein [Pyrinomonadaceae bacterium]
MIFGPTITCAQDEPRAAWQVTRYDINASALINEQALTARATLTLRNTGRGAGSTLSVRINPKAEVKTVSVNGATATFRSAAESRGNLQRVTITIPSPIAPDVTANVTIDYRLPVAENSGLAAITPLNAQFLPLSFWYPTPNTIFTLRGADTAPFRLMVNAAGGETVISSGRANGSTFEQPLNAQPFFLSGSWEMIEGAGEARGVSAFLSKGAGAEERKQAEALIALTAAARSFYAGLLGPAPEAPVRLVAVTRGAGFSETGTVLLSAAAFRRTKIDSVTALLIAEAVARLWIGGETAVRGEGSGVLREGLTRFLANLFLEKHYGRETADAERMRQRFAYAAVAKRDAPLSRTTPLDDTYFTSVTNKGSMIWQLVDRALGRDVFMGVLRGLLQAGKGERGELTLDGARAALVERGGASLKTLLDQGLDQPTEMDLMVGLPQQRAGQWAAALRNIGSFDANVTVAAITDRGERLTTEVIIPARNFGEAVFKTASKIVRVEVDPDKLYPQLDYSNDVAPRTELTEDALAEASRLFVRQDYARVEAAARSMLALTPRMQEARVLLARALLAQNKTDEAEKEFRAALNEPVPTPATLAWANLGLGEISLRKGQAAEAARRFNEAVRADAEYASTLTARSLRIKAEAAANAAPAPDDSAKNFIAQLDQAIRSGRKAEIDAQIIAGELIAFSKGIVGSQPELWQTRVLRTEQIDAQRLAADVSINAKQLGGEQSGTAVLILARVGGAWKLEAIEFFEVR